MRRLLAVTVCGLGILGATAPATQAQGLIARWGGVGEKPGKFKDLKDIAVDDRGYVYTLEQFSSDGRVQKFTPGGRLVRQFGRPEDDDNRYDTDQIRGALYYPEGIAIGPGGNVYVSESGSDRTRVSVWSPRGKFLRAFGDNGSGPGQFSNGSGLAVDPAGNVYLADSGNGRIGVFNSRGGWLRSIGFSDGYNSETAFLNAPGDVTLSGSRLFIPDSGHIKVWNTNGTSVGLFGQDTDAPGGFSSADSAAFFGSTLYVADSRLSRVQSFAINGTKVRYTGRIGLTPGNQPGQLTKPVAVATDCRGSVYVADAGNYRVQRFGAKGAKPCGNIAKDPDEKFRLKLGGKKRQRFRANFAVRPAVRCDRPCRVTLTGSVKVDGRRKAVKLSRSREFIEYPDATGINVAPGERGTDVIASAVRRHRRVTARVKLVARDLTGRTRVKRNSYRLR